MTQPRHRLVSLEATPYYHCMARCVRRAFLCGRDALSGRSYEHRRDWIRERLALLTRVFAIEVCAYALMSNHYHLVLRLAPEQAASWSDEAVIARWRQVFKGPALVQRYAQGEALSAGERARVREIVATWRARLGELSWFMRCLNEHIARAANAEDECTGHFWEARFRSQALLDEGALLQGMVYVDLNPIRAGIASSVPDSAYTAAQQRFRALMASAEGEAEQPAEPAALPRLAALRTPDTRPEATSLPFDLRDYLELLESTGRCCVAGKRGFIDEAVPRLIDQCGLDAEQWLTAMAEPQGLSPRALGAPAALRAFAEQVLGQRWVHGIARAAALHPT